MSRPDYKTWWHDRTEGVGLATVLDAQPVYRATTRHHTIEVLSHAGLGWVFAVDGELQGVERDAGDRELRIHVPLLGRARRACRVLLLGGGDGALLHELLVHPFVTQVVLWEPDAALVEVGSTYLGFGADLSDARVEIRAPSREHDAPFDLIVRAGNGRFHLGLAEWLADDGVYADTERVVPGRGPWNWYQDGPGTPFGHAEHYFTASPLSTGGFMGFFLHTRDGRSYAEPQSVFTGLTYNPRLHRAAFALPSFWPAPEGC